MQTTSTRIADITTGRTVEGLYVVLASSRRLNRNGDPYLVLELSDESGRIEGRVWENADHFARHIAVGDTVTVVGRGSTFRDQLQLDIRRIERTDAPEGATFIPAARRPLDDLVGELDFHLGEITDPLQAGLCAAIWNGADREQLHRSPATASDHHAYLGGLVEHTVGVTSIALAAADRHERIDRSLLLTACLLHDIGRAHELQVGERIEADRDGALVGHLVLGHEMLIDAASALASGGADPRLAPWWAPLVHAIQHHHGPLERCRTREALVLASANQLDVRLAGRD